MADQKVKVFDGTSWVGIESNSTLPISNEEESVKLDGDSDVFTVTIGNSQRVLVDADSSDFEGKIICSDFISRVEVDPAEIQLTSNIVFECVKLTRFNANAVIVLEVSGEKKGIGINTVATDKAGLTVKTEVVSPQYGTQGVWSNGSVSPNTDAGRKFDSFLSQPSISSPSSCEVYHFRSYDNATSTTSGRQAGFISDGLTASTKQNVGFWSQVAQEVGKTNYAFFASSNAPSYFNGDILTDTIAGKVPGDSSVRFVGKELSLTGDVVIFDVGTGSYNFDLKQNIDGAAGGDGILLLTREYDLSFSSDTIRFNADYTGGPAYAQWTMETDGGFVAYNSNSYIDVPTVNGINPDSTSIKLNSQATLTNKDGSDYVVDSADSIATKRYVDANSSEKITSGTPAASNNPASSAGSMMFDENYLWLKTSTAWKKIPLAGFAAPAATATVQLSESQYQALSPKDPNTLYIIVG